MPRGTELPAHYLMFICTRVAFIPSAFGRLLLARKGVHGPADSDSDHQKKKKRPQNIFQSILWLPSSQIAKRHGNDRGKKQKRLNVRQINAARGAHAFRPRAASNACNAASRFNTPAVARNRVP